MRNKSLHAHTHINVHKFVLLGFDVRRFGMDLAVGVWVVSSYRGKMRNGFDQIGFDWLGDVTAYSTCSVVLPKLLDNLNTHTRTHVHTLLTLWSFLACNLFLLSCKTFLSQTHAHGCLGNSAGTSQRKA